MPATAPSNLMKRTITLAAIKKIARKNPLGTNGFAFVMLMVFFAWFADVIKIYEPVAISSANTLLSPNADFSLERSARPRYQLSNCL